MSFPVVPLDSIPAQGLEVDVQGWALAACAVGLGGPAREASGHLAVNRQGRDIGVRGDVHGAADLVCDRCGAALSFAADAAVDCLYLAPRGEDEAPPETDYEDLGEYDGVALDLAHVVSESLALERPFRVLCGEVDPAEDAACLARFRAKAGTSEGTADLRFSVLKNFKPE